MTTEQETFELLHLTVEVDDYGSLFYLNSTGHVHRDSGPAVIYSSGDWAWVWRDMCHRVGGPATYFGGYFLFHTLFNTKAEYELECANKTMPQWKEYDEYIRAMGL